MLTNYVDVGRQTVDVGVYRPSFDGGVGVIRALGESEVQVYLEVHGLLLKEGTKVIKGEYHAKTFTKT
jgi:hypothetical protein